ncbi:MAG TPA: cupin domain-containing protein [Xanthobacteraceae bacterium]|nr:cupin domain-containing protein [Xanthobacteraceae bacterium]
MAQPNRRIFLGALALGAGSVASTRSFASPGDGHAAGYDVAPASKYLPLIPRKSGEPAKFTAALDQGPIKATTGGWARDTTARQLPIATDIAGAHLFINAGGAREMHWHNSAEWAFVLGGHCQVTVVDPAGAVEVVNLAAGDLWYFPRAHSHAIQTLGTEPCHAVLAFDDGLYGEHGTFGVSDWMSRFDAADLAQAYGVDAAWLADIPKGETYIMQGPVIPRDSEQARSVRPLDPARSHRFALLAQKPKESSAGGTIHIASAREFPIATTMTTMRLTLAPGAMHQPHWHANASEWHYVVKGRTKITLFGNDKLMADAELGPGDSAYIPRGCGHSVKNIGAGECELVGVLNAPEYQESRLADWFAKAPRHLLANNFGMPADRVPHFADPAPTIIAAR